MNPVITRWKIGGCLDLPRQKTATQRTIRHKPHAQIPACLEYPALRIARPQRVFRLNRRDRMHRVGALQCRRAHFAQTKIFHFARRDQFGHRPHRFFNRRGGVDAMLIVEIDHIDIQPFETRLAGRSHIFRPAVDPALQRFVRVAHESELRRQHHLFPTTGDRTADKLLIRPRPVHIGGIQKVQPPIQSMMDRCDRFRIIARAIEIAHAHATQADFRDCQITKVSHFHCRFQ